MLLSRAKEHDTARTSWDGTDAGPAELLLEDRYTDELAMGGVVGTTTPTGAARHVVDVERAIGADNGALRIQPLIEPGWGRAALAYGPYPREPGLACAIFMLNGHNTSQSENLPDGFRRRLTRWWLGSETYPGRVRVLQWLRHSRKHRMMRRLRAWWRASVRPMPVLNENLAVGFFSEPAAADPLAGGGDGFVMHATGAENGELWVKVGSSGAPVIRGVQNLPIYFIVVLRERGAAYYVSSVDGANGMIGYPSMRPVGIDPLDESPRLFAGLQQSVLGQIGFRLDTRVYGTKVARIARLANWYGTAHLADGLRGEGPLDGSRPEIGNGSWRVIGARALARQPDGAGTSAEEALGLLEGEEESGLVHVCIRTGDDLDGVSAGLCWRVADEGNLWSVRADARGIELLLSEDGRERIVATDPGVRLRPGAMHSLQILDDGRAFRILLDGTLAFGRQIADERLASATGVGFRAADPHGTLRLASFEAHPRSVDLPEILRMGAPWLEFGDRVVVRDSFRGPARDLAGSRTELGGKEWRRDIGEGRIRITGADSARVDASVERPNPYRTVYTIPWDEPQFADLEVTITPPGTAQGQREHGRAGLILWQDEDNYIVINTWVADSYDGSSISSFFHLEGFEDLYDAIWTNVGRRVRWGGPSRLRVVCDGSQYCVLVDGEPVLYRAVKDVYPNYPVPFRINRVGLVANWEWGNDTGSVFREFIGRSRYSGDGAV